MKENKNLVKIMFTIILKILLLFKIGEAIPTANELEGGFYDCVNPAEKYGRCILLTNCDPLFSILKNWPIEKESIKYLQRSTCGFVGSEPKVCCVSKTVLDMDWKEKEKEKQITTTTTTTTTTEKPTTKSYSPPKIPIEGGRSSNFSGDSPRATLELVKKHKNLRLLPSVKNCGKSFGSDRIIGGTDAGLGNNPWMVLLGIADPEGQVQYACGGSLISKRYVLTAAHCCKNLPTGYTLTTVRVGEYNQSAEIDCVNSVCAPRVQNMEIEDIIYHEKYDLTNKKENDIALLRLKKDVDLGPFVVPICLPVGEHFPKPQNYSTKRYLNVAGWGREDWEKEDNSNVLKEVKVPIVSMDLCNKFYGGSKYGTIDNGRFCAGGERGRDSCLGDSGGPIVSPYQVKSLRNQPRTFQLGIVSLGPAKCGSAGQPGLYTKVSYFLPWILDNIKP